MYDIIMRALLHGLIENLQTHSENLQNLWNIYDNYKNIWTHIRAYSELL